MANKSNDLAHIVADPPRLTQNISVKTIGTGLKLKRRANSTVTTEKNGFSHTFYHNHHSCNK